MPDLKNVQVRCPSSADREWTQSSLDGILAEMSATDTTSRYLQRLAQLSALNDEDEESDQEYEFNADGEDEYSNQSEEAESVDDAYSMSHEDGNDTPEEDDGPKKVVRRTARFVRPPSSTLFEVVPEYCPKWRYKQQDLP